jgi:hypothetical protein
MKRVFWSLVVGLALLVIACSNESKPTQASVGSENTNSPCPTCDGNVSFAKSLSTAELASVVKDNGIEIKEFSYQDGDVTGGYVLQNGEGIESAIDNFKSKHISFLVEAGSNITANLAKESDAVALSGYQSLGKKMSTMLAKARAGDISIVGMKVAPGSLEKVKGLNIISNVSTVETAPTGLSKSTNIQSTSHESWAPYYGKSKVTRQLTFQFLYFNNISDFGSTSTYECETQVYDKNYADFDGYWSSNFPRAYYDTPFLDQLDNFTVGCAQASSLQINTMYYAEMTLRQQTSPTALVRIKGQKGHRFPSGCYSTWCIIADATTGSLTYFTAPISSYLEWWY